MVLPAAFSPRSELPEIAGRWTDRWPPEVLLVVALAMATVASAPLNPDTGYCLVAGRRLLAGARLYVDLMETNPPMIFWLMAGLTWMGRALPLSDARLMGCFVAALVAVSALLGLRILADSPRTPRFTRFSMVSTFLVALILPYVMWTGQREQIAVLLVFPYTLLTARAARGLPSGRALSICSGVLAGVGLTIKPFFLAAWLAGELVILVSTRRWPSRDRSEFWAVALVQCAFGAVVMIATREYVTDMVPLARQFYGAYGGSRLAIMRGRPFWMLALAGIAAMALPKRSDATSGLPHARVFGAATLGWLIAYVAQGKGWYYHLLPAVAYGAVALTLTGLNIVALVRETLRGQMRAVYLGALAVPVAMIIWEGRRVLPRLGRDAVHVLKDQQPEPMVRLTDYIESVAMGEPVYFFSTNVWPAFPIVNTSGAKWPYHYHFLWPIPALYARVEGHDPPYRVPEAQGALERRFFDTVIEDLERTPPRVLVIVGGPNQQAMRGRPFDFVTYFSGSPEFRLLFRQYQRRGSIGDWEVYERR